MKRIHLIFLATIFLTTLRLPAQDSTVAGVSVRSFNEEKWKSLTNDLDYPSNAGKAREKPAPQKDASDTESTLPAFAYFFRFLFFGLLTTALIWIIWRVVQEQQSGGASRKNKIGPQQDLTPMILEEGGVSVEGLEGEVQRAAAAGDYRLATRLQYLDVLHTLHQAKLLRWRKEKTNLDYLRELHGTPFYETFQSLTTVFEKSWYGRQALSQAEYEQLQPFITLLQGAAAPKTLRP